MRRALDVILCRVSGFAIVQYVKGHACVQSAVYGAATHVQIAPGIDREINEKHMFLAIDIELS